MSNAINLTTQDPMEFGIIHQIEDGEDLELRVELGNSEDTGDWERQADAHLNELGFRRVSPWTDEGTTVEIQAGAPTAGAGDRHGTDSLRRGKRGMYDTNQTKEMKIFIESETAMLDRHADDEDGDELFPGFPKDDHTDFNFGFAGTLYTVEVFIDHTAQIYGIYLEVDDSDRHLSGLRRFVSSRSDASKIDALVDELIAWRSGE